MNEETSPPPSQREALASLTEIQQITMQTRQTLAGGMASPILMLWGVIWFVGFTYSQYATHPTGMIWLILDAVGFAGTAWLSVRQRGKLLKQGDARPVWCLCQAWLILFAYMILWGVLLSSNTEPTGDKLGAFFITVPMCAYMIMGLWLGRFFFWLGAAVTLLTFIGYYSLPHYFYLWMAVTGGGALLGTGWHLRFNWK